MGDNTQWRALPSPTLLWRDWGADAVVFDTSSWRTHQLTPLAATALAWLEEQAQTCTSLTAALAADLGTTPDDTLQRAVATLLDEFVERDWIEAQTPAG